jgi:glutathione-specific gamma-glutamylcyclotransferase
VATLIDLDHWKTLTDDVTELLSLSSLYEAHSYQHTTAPERVWGAAYHIPREYVAAVRDYLDIREINGYSIQYTPFKPSDPSQGVLNCLVYIGLPSNPQFMGPQDPDRLARHILKSKGPSGENREYLYMLEAALEGLSKESGDEHVSDLAARCRKLEAEGVRGPENRKVEADGLLLHKVGSTEEQEEVEKVGD